MIGDVFFKLLASAQGAAIRALLGSYSGQPAIFTAQVPDKAPTPFIKINVIGGMDDSDRGASGSVINADVQVFDKKSYSEVLLHSLAKQIYDLVHHHDLWPWIEDAGFQLVSCIAEPPADTQEGLGFPGRTIRVQVRLKEFPQS